MKLLLLVTHLPNGRLAFKQSAELQTDVCRTRAIAILWKLASLILADAQTPHLLFHCRLHLLPGSAWPQTAAARLAGMVLRGDAHHEALTQLSHQADAHGGWITGMR